MGRQIICILFLAAISTLVSGQGASVGIKAGLNLAKLSSSVSAPAFGSANSVTDTYASFYAGVFAVVMMNDKMGLQPEVLYSGQGGDLGNASFRLNYLNVPIMPRYCPVRELSLQAGPQLGIFLSAETSGVDAKDQMNTTDFGLAFGLGYVFPIKLELGFRYVVGLTNIYKADLTATGIPGLTVSMNNQVLQFMVGYRS